MKTPGYYDQSAYGLLCLSSVRRLFPLRHGVHGDAARKACLAWLNDLRIVRQLEKEIAP